MKQGMLWPGVRTNKVKSQSALAIAVIFLASLVGCRSAFQPPSATFLLWSKQGERATNIKKALLECGDPNPYDAIDREWIDGKLVTYTTIEDSAASELCTKTNSYQKKHACSATQFATCRFANSKINVPFQNAASADDLTANSVKGEGSQTYVSPRRLSRFKFNMRQ